MENKTSLLRCLLPLMAVLGCLCSSVWAQLPNSGQTSSFPYLPPVSEADPAYWFLEAGYANIQVSSETAPDSSPVMEVDVTQAKGVSVENQLLSTVDLRSYDSFAFWIRASATRSPNFAYLLDANGNRRWYSLYLNAARGWEQEQYWVSSYVGEDAGFNVEEVTSVKFNQAGELAGDQIWIGPVVFEHNAVNHCESAGDWNFDIPGSIGDTIQTSTDRIAGFFSIQATGNASSWGQMDIATSQSQTGVTWNWANKVYLSFYYKDSYSEVSHYALVYDANGNYVEWVFQATPGAWNKITIELADDSYYFYPNPPDLSHVVSFEVGIFGGTTYAPYSFQVDEVSVH